MEGEIELDVAGRWEQAERLSSSAGGREAARTLYQSLLADRMYAPLARLRLSILCHQSGDLRGATAHAMAAFSAAYGDPELLELLCKTLLPLGETRPALACASALAGMESPIPSLAEVGKLLSDYMEPEAAVALLQRAEAQGLPATPALRYLLGLNLTYLGRLEDARLELEGSLHGDPSFAPALWTMSKVGGPGGREERIDRLKSVLGSIEEPTRNNALLWYSLFHELDAADRPVEAWPALEAGMRLRRKQVHHDDEQQAILFDAALRALEWIDEGRQSAPAEGPQPVFVVGMPRTGTTLIEQHLCTHADMASAGELRDLAAQARWCTSEPGPFHMDARLLQALGPEHLSELGQRYLDHTQWRARGAAFYADKWPENYLAIGPILAALPGARVVCVQRGAMDTCFSNLKEWFASSYYYSYDMGETARQYARFRGLLDRIEALRHPRVAIVRYEEFVERPLQVLAELCTALALPTRGTGTRPERGVIATASAVQARKRVSRGHIGAWRRYADHLQPLAHELARLHATQGHPCPQ